MRLQGLRESRDKFARRDDGIMDRDKVKLFLSMLDDVSEDDKDELLTYYIYDDAYDKSATAPLPDYLLLFS